MTLSNPKIREYSVFDLRISLLTGQNKSKDDKRRKASKIELNNSDLIKSCNENISNIMEVSLKEEDGNVIFKEMRNRSSSNLPDEYYFTTNRKTHSNMYEDKINDNKKKKSSRAKHIKSTGMIHNTLNNNSTSQIEHSAEEIKESDVKPYNFISEKTKAEILNKMKSKEKYNSNWFNESESSSLSYSKVFNASGRDYCKHIAPIKKEIEVDQEKDNLSNNKNDNFSKILSYPQENNVHKFTSYNYPIKERSSSENSKDSVESECNDDYGDVNYIESREGSDLSPDNTKKNILIQENILIPEGSIVTLEEVKEYENESHSQDTDRKNSTLMAFNLISVYFTVLAHSCFPIESKT